MENVNYIILDNKKKHKEKSMIELEKTIDTVEIPLKRFTELLEEAYTGRLAKEYLAGKSEYTSIPWEEVQLLKSLFFKDKEG